MIIENEVPPIYRTSNSPLRGIVDFRYSCPMNPFDNVGIGDAIVGLHIVQALERKYGTNKVRFFGAAKQVEWAKLWTNSFFVDAPGAVNFSPGEHQFWGLSAGTLTHATEDRRLVADKTTRIESAAKLCGVLDYLQPLYAIQGEEFVRHRINKPIVVISPAALSHQRAWPLQNYYDLADMMKDYHIVAIGTAADKDRFGGFGGAYGAEEVLLDSRPSQIVGLLRKAALYIGNDSGITHLAGALGVKAIAICAPTSGAVVFGWYKSVRVIQSHDDCSICYFGGDKWRRGCGIGCDALSNLTPEFIYNEARSFHGI